MQTLQTLEAPGATFASPALPSLVLPSTSEAAAPQTGAANAAPILPMAPFIETGDSLSPILVADDDSDDVFFIQRLIKKTGVKNPIKVFDDGSEVVNFLGSVQMARAAGRRRSPLLLFLDLNMRGLGGFGFLEWARQQKGLGPLTIVVLSNSNEPEIVQRALELGAHRYLVKYPCVQTVSTIIRSVYPQTVF